MKRILFLLFIAGCYITTEAGKCTRPNLSRNLVYIYSPFGKVPIKISRCFFNDTKDAYSDISDNCLKAFQSGVFIDKWADNNKLLNTDSPVVLDEYISRADLVKNEVTLRSGTVCSYDRGFCYDPKEANAYGVVWQLLERSTVQCPEQLYKVFEGDVDIWSFPQGLNYLFYYDNVFDEAFYLGLKSKGQCQDSDVWYTEEGYIVSKKPLTAKNIEGLASLKARPSVKGGVKGGTKGGVKSARLTGFLPNRSYFTLKSKKVVSDAILRNCDTLSLTLEQIIEELTSEYLQDTDNVRFLMKTYYDLIKNTKEDVLDIIKRESSLNLTLELKHELFELTQRFEKILHDIKNIQEILASAGNLKGIRSDVDNLDLEIKKLLKKIADNDELFDKISITLQQHGQALDEKGAVLQKLSEKLEQLQNFINNQLPNLITKTEVYDKLNELEQGFHKKVRELAMNVTLLLLQHEGSAGVKGKGTTNAELEQIIIEKLKGFNLDQQQAAIDALKDKIELLINQLRSESYNNATYLENKIYKKIDELAAQNVPILDRLSKVEKNINNLNSLIDNLKTDLGKREKSLESALKEFDAKISKIWDEFGNYDKKLSDLKKDLIDLSKKEVDFGPIYKKISDSINEALKPRDGRLDALDDISAKLIETIEKDNLDIDNLQKQINEINQGLKKVDDLKGDITDEFEKEVRPVHTQLSALNGAMEEHSKKQTATHEDLQEAKNVIRSELDYLRQRIKDVVIDLNATVEKNSDLIEKLIDHDTVLDKLIDDIKKDLGDNGQHLKTLETNVKDILAQCDSSNKKINQDVGNLHENITDLYDIIKNQEESILELTKKCEKAELESHAKSSVKTSGTKGGVKTSGTKGGVKTTRYYNQQNNADYDEFNSEKKSKIVQTPVDDWYDEGSYSQTKTSHVYTKSPQGHSGHNIQSNDKQEINFLRIQLSEAQISLQAHEHRIESLEKKLTELSHRIIATDDALTHSVKSLDTKVTETKDNIEILKYEIHGELSTCCNNKASYTGIKH